MLDHTDTTEKTMVTRTPTLTLRVVPAPAPAPTPGARPFRRHLTPLSERLAASPSARTER